MSITSGSVRAAIIALERTPQARRFHAHDGIDLRIEAVRPAKHFRRDSIGLDVSSRPRASARR